MSKRVCRKPGCPRIQDAPECDEHRRARDRERGTTTERGYGAEHQQLRADMQGTVIGQPCARCGHMILPTDTWHLDHTDDRSGYLGPSHARCNVAAGGRAAHGERGISPDA